MDIGANNPRPSPDNAAERLPQRDFFGKDNRLLKVERVLSEAGTQAQVLKAVYQDNGEPVAIKLYRDTIGGSTVSHEGAQTEADVMRVLTAGKVPHILNLHNFHKGAGRGNSNRSYIVMDLAKGEDATDIEGRNGFSEIQALAVTRQAWECLAAASAAGVRLRDLGIKGVMFNPEDNSAAFFDWGGGVIFPNPSFNRGANVADTIVNYAPSKMGIKDPQLDAVRAVEDLRNLLIERYSCDAQKTDSDIILSSVSNAATSASLTEMLDRIFSGESYSSLRPGIDALIQKRVITIAQTEVMEPAQLGRVMPPHNLSEQYCDLLIRRIIPEDQARRSLSHDLYWLTEMMLLKVGQYPDYLKGVERNTSIILARPELAQIHDQVRFIQSVAESTSRTVAYLSQDDRTAACKIMGNMYMDILTLGLRPDLATDGNRARLREGLGKLAQYLTPEQKAQAQQILASLQIPEFEVPTPQVVAAPEVVVPVTPKPEEIVAAAPQIVEELPIAHEAVLSAAAPEPEPEEAEDGERYPEITAEMRDQKLNELATASQTVYELWKFLAFNKAPSDRPGNLINALKNGQDVIAHKPIDLEDERIKRLLRPVVFLHEVINDFHTTHRGWLRDHGLDYNQVSRCILDCLLFGKQTPRDTLNEAKRFMHALTADQSIRESLVGEWKQVPLVLKEEILVG